METYYSSNEKKVAQGRLGEMIVGRYLKIAEGAEVVYSDNQFDSEKDMLANGVSVEVKTMEEFHTQRAFSFAQNQLWKCRNVGRLFMIALNSRDRSRSGKCYEIDPKTFTTKFYTTRDNRNMILIPIDQPAVKFAFQVEPKMVAQLHKFSTSEWGL